MCSKWSHCYQVAGECVCVPHVCVCACVQLYTIVQPNSMGINPSDKECEPFYDKMKELDMVSCVCMRIVFVSQPNILFPLSRLS